MAGPAKNRNDAQKKQQQQQQAARSSDNSSSSRDPTQRSINKFDGNKDPHGHGAGVMDYTRANDLKNLSEFLGMAGWYTARGVSANAPVSACICMRASNCSSCIPIMQTSGSRAPALHGMEAQHKYFLVHHFCLLHHSHIHSFFSKFDSFPFLPNSHIVVVHLLVPLTISLLHHVFQQPSPPDVPGHLLLPSSS